MSGAETRVNPQDFSKEARVCPGESPNVLHVAFADINRDPYKGLVIGDGALMGRSDIVVESSPVTGQNADRYNEAKQSGIHTAEDLGRIACML